MAESRKILIVDDEEIVRDLLIDALSDSSFGVEAAESGPAALDLLGKPGSCFDLVVVDMSMPEMDGLELSIKIKKILPAQKIVISTGNYLSDDEIAELKRIGVNETIGKPFNIAKMVSLFEKLIISPSI